jgi:hypothetical protein
MSAPQVKYIAEEQYCLQCLCHLIEYSDLYNLKKAKQSYSVKYPWYGLSC